MILHPSHIARNILNLFDTSKIRVIEGDYGLRMVVGEKWANKHTNYANRHGIKEIRLNDSTLNEFNDSLDFLAQINCIESLSIGWCGKINDLSPIGNLRQLKSLCLDYGAKDGLGFSLPSLPQLERLYLGERIVNEEQVFLLSGLKRLGLTKYPTKQPSKEFSNLVNLEYLSVAESGLSEIEGLWGLKKISEIHLLRLKHLVSLKGLEGSSTMLRKIRIEGCPTVGRIDSVGGAAGLEELYLYDCGNIPSLAPISDLVNLRVLAIGGNTNIVDGKIGFLKEMPSLRDLRGAHRKHYDLSHQEFSVLCGRKK